MQNKLENVSNDRTVGKNIGTKYDFIFSSTFGISTYANKLKIRGIFHRIFYRNETEIPNIILFDFQRTRIGAHTCKALLYTLKTHN